MTMIINDYDMVSMPNKTICVDYYFFIVHADDYVFRLEILASTPGTETELV